MAGEPEAGTQPEPIIEIDTDAIDDLPQEEIGKLQRGEIEPPKKGAKAPEKDAGPKDEFDVDPKSETVPHAVFHRNNERRKAAEAETVKERTAREKIEQQNTILSQRFTELLEASKSVPQQEDRPAITAPGEEPDPEADPYGWINWRAQKDRYDSHQQETQRTQQTEQQLAVQHVLQTAARGVQEFTATTPDYQTARLFVWNQRGPELMELGYSQEQAIAMLEQDELRIADGALRSGKNPAEVMYKLAKIRGYIPPTGDDPAATNGTTPPRGADGKFQAAAAEMDKREATKAAAKSLGGSGGPADTGEITPQVVADMSNEEFAAFKKKYGEKAMQKAFGVAQ